MSEVDEQYYRESARSFGKVRILLFAIAGPLLLVPVEIVIPLPHVVEELYKAMLVVWLLNYERSGDDGSTRNTNYLLAIFVGLLFGLSESVLFITNAFFIGNFEALLSRLVVTVPMHAATTFILYTMGRVNRVLMMLGLIVTMAIHYWFNTMV